MKAPCFVLTNDPDHATTEHTRRVFELLNRYGVKVTTAVFNVVKESSCWLGSHCRPRETASLADPEFRNLMLEQKRRGHEIAYHGYCQLGETREEFNAGLEEFRSIFGEYPYTYIEHGPNPKTHPDAQCRPNTLVAGGSEPGSPYYILDLLREKCRVVWTQEDLLGFHHLTDPTGPLLEEPVEFFRLLDDGLIHFHRYRLYLFQHEPFFRVIQNQGASFVGYTHFGYPYHGGWARWGVERWDDLDGANRGFWEWVSRQGFRFKTLRDFHLEDAGGGNVSGRLADPEGISGPLRVDSDAVQRGQSQSGLDSGVTSNGHVEGGSTSAESPLAGLPDPLESLGLRVQGRQMRVQGEFLESQGLTYWGAQIQLLDQLLRCCRTVLSIGEGDGRLLVPLMNRHGFHLTVIDPYIESYEALLEDLRFNLRLFDVEDRCRVERSSFQEFISAGAFDAVVAMGLALDECWKGTVPNAPASLAKMYKMTRKVMAAELRQPVFNGGFQHEYTPRETFISWTFKETLSPGLLSSSIPTSSQ